MFVSDALIFVELHKTAGTHIGRCLASILDGKQVGKHNRVPPELRSRFILGSIRNPWDWYVSLWAFGCDGNGSVYHQTTRRFDFSYYHRQLNKEMGKDWLYPAEILQQLGADAVKPVGEWRKVYADSRNPVLFRRWLAMIFDSNRRFDMGEGFGFSPLSQHSGILTYRFFKLFTDLGRDLYMDKTLAQKSNLNSLWRKHSIIDYIVRNENLEKDLLSAMAKANITLTDEQLKMVLLGKSKKTNASSKLSTEFYYDADSARAIASKESFIITNFGYYMTIL